MSFLGLFEFAGVRPRGFFVFIFSATIAFLNGTGCQSVPSKESALNQPLSSESAMRQEPAESLSSIQPRSIAGFGFFKKTPVPNELTYESLLKILQEKNFSRIQDLMEYLSKGLSKKYEDYLSFHTFGYDSKSLHGSSFENPRALIYGRTARFIITFNNDPKHRGYEMLEVVQFNDDLKKFEFREIRFKNDALFAQSQPLEDFSQKQEGRFLKWGFQISPVGGPKYQGHYLMDDLMTDPLDGKKPPKLTFPEGKCHQCHTNGRPIWESYPHWPGFYGAEDDAFTFAINGVLKSNHSKISPQMRKAYSLFTEKRKGTRYDFSNNMGNDDDYGSPRPNGLLNVLFGRLNYQRIERILSDARKEIQMTPEKCALLKNPGQFTAQAVELQKKYVSANLNRMETSMRETFGEEAAIKSRNDYVSNYYRRQLEDLKAGALNDHRFLDFAVMEAVFPEVQSKTFSPTLYESGYDFHAPEANAPKPNNYPEFLIRAFVQDMSAACH